MGKNFAKGAGIGAGAAAINSMMGGGEGASEYGDEG